MADREPEARDLDLGRSDGSPLLEREEVFVAVEVYIPKMSDHMEAGEVIRWLAGEGDRVEEGQPILELMTDKVVAELPAPASGLLKGVRAGAGDGAVVRVGETIAFIAAPGEAVPTLPPLSQPKDGTPDSRAARRQPRSGAPGQPPSRAPVAVAPPSPAGAEPGKVRATPAARAAARALGVDLALVTGTGPEGRIREEDVQAFAAAAGEQPTAASTAPASTAEAAPTGPAEEDAEWVDLTSIQRLTGQRMVASVQSIPHFVLGVSADATNLLSARAALAKRILAETGERLSITPLLVKVVAVTLRNHPRVNASFEDGRVRLHRQVNVGVAIGTEDGLVVPVVRQADQKALAEIVGELKAFRQKARDLRFSAADLSGGTFTISNLGMHGVDHFTATINPPESAVLAVGRIAKRPVGTPDDTIALRPMVSLTLSVDHRAMDGLQAARFLSELKERMEKACFALS